jgi:YhcH/YjgK/YiaL family protein
MNAMAQKHTSKPKMTEQQETVWVKQFFVKEGVTAIPAPSVNTQLLYQHIKLHPNRWKTACNFLTNNNLNMLPLGIKVLSDKVFVNVQEYTTRDPGKQYLEAHRKYIDFQYVVSGRELMGSGKLSDATMVDPYDSTKDAGHYSLPIFPYYVATPQYFFVFFPSQVHLTNIQFGEKAAVRKIVFKILVK